MGTSIGLIFAAFIALLVFVAVKDNERWEAFKTLHHCRIVGTMSPSTGVGPSMSGDGGIAVVVIPGKTGWLCNDGMTYWR